jgi:hypothetical protein
MTTEQAIEQFKANPDIVPDELSNKLVEDCLEKLLMRLWQSLTTFLCLKNY